MAEQRELIARLEQDLSTIQSIQRPDAEVSPLPTLFSLANYSRLFLQVLPANFTMKAHFRMPGHRAERQASSSWHKVPRV